MKKYISNEIGNSIYINFKWEMIRKTEIVQFSYAGRYALLSLVGLYFPAHFRGGSGEFIIKNGPIKIFK